MCINKLERERYLFFGVLLLLFCFPWAASAQDQPRIALSTGAQKEVTVEKDGKRVTERIPLDKASPGDKIVYTITYRNAGTTIANDVLINDSIPAGTIYLLNSAEGKDAEITFSIDGGRTYSKPPIKYMVKNPDGTRKEGEAPAEVYTHIKWVIGKAVSPGASGQVSFKVGVK